MPENITPISTRKSTSGATWRPYIVALHDYVANTSSQWNVIHLTDNGAGNDFGFTLEPDDAAENFYVNWQFDASNLVPRIHIDPQQTITDPLDPVGTGSSETSPGGHPAGRSDPGSNESWHNEILIQDWDDALGFLVKHSSNAYIRHGLIGGRIYQPTFAGTDVYELDGLGWRGGDPNNVDTTWWRDISTSIGSTSRMRVPGGWAKVQTRVYDENRSFNPWGTHIPAAILFDVENTQGLTVGVAKYAYGWESTSGNNGLRRVQSASGDGLLHVSYDGSQKSLVTPWDPTVSPI